FALPLSTQGQRWSGFYQSELKKGGNRYMAKCKFCLIEFSDKPEKLHLYITKREKRSSSQNRPKNKYYRLQTQIYIHSNKEDLAMYLERKKKW
ncbi:41904_t:CDS:2, partial [Gigaspora margarita]